MSRTFKEEDFVPDTEAPTGPSSGKPATLDDAFRAMNEERKQKGVRDLASAEARGNWSADDFLPDYANGQSPETPINKSPIDLTDRALLSATGNKAGHIKYLKKKFDDARIDKSGNVLVQKEDLWYRADAVGLGDGNAWERTKELAKDFADLSDIAVNTAGSMYGAAKGAAVGAVMGGPPGAAVGGIAGAAVGGGASQGIRTSLGRFFGTYDATPQEQLRDAGYEALLGLGGQVLAAGARPTFGVLKAAVSKIGEKTTNVGKELMATFWEGTTGEAKSAFRYAMDNPKVIDLAENFVAHAPDGAAPAVVQANVTRLQGRILTAASKTADTALKGRYVQELNGFVNSVPKNFSAPLNQMLGEVGDDLVSRGIATWDKNQLRLMKPTEVRNFHIDGMHPQQGVPTILSKEMEGAAAQVIEVLNKYSTMSARQSFSGKEGAKKLVEFRSAIKESLSNIVGDGAGWKTPTGKLVAGVKDAFESKLLGKMRDFGVDKQFTKFNQTYSTYKDSVRLLQNAVSSKEPQAIDNLVKRLTSKEGSQIGLKDEITTLSDLTPKMGEYMKKLRDMEAAKSFIPLAPKTFTGGTGTSLTRVATLPLGQSSPRAIGKVIKYADKTLDFLKGPAQRNIDQLLSHDQALATLLKAPFEATRNEDETTQRLMQLAEPQTESQ